MPEQITQIRLGVMRHACGPDWMPLADFIATKGCSRHTVLRRLDIQTKKISGHVFVHRSALDVKIRERRSFGKGGDA